MSDRRDETDLSTALAIFDEFPIPVVEQVAREFDSRWFIGHPDAGNGRVMQKVSIEIPPVPDKHYPGQTYEKSCLFCPIGRAMYLDGRYRLDNGGYEIVLAGIGEVRDVSVLGIVTGRQVVAMMVFGTRWAAVERLMSPSFDPPKSISANLMKWEQTLDGYYFQRVDRDVPINDDVLFRANRIAAQAGLFISNWDDGVIDQNDFAAYIAKRKEADGSISATT